MFKCAIEKIKFFVLSFSSWIRAHRKDVFAVALILLMALVMVYCLSSCSHFSMKVDKMEGAEMVLNKTKEGAKALTDCVRLGLPFRA